MSVLLSLETATGVCSAALHEDGKLLATVELHVAQSASSRLSVMIDELFSMCDMKADAVDAVAVSSGPGSYTGLRIGVATAKGICFALQKPLLSVNTLELMTSEVIDRMIDKGIDKDLLFCPMLDARRMEVYCLLSDEKLNVVEGTSAKVIDEVSFKDDLEKGKIIFFGNGAEKCREILKHRNAVFLDGVVPEAAKMGHLAFEKFKRSDFEDLAGFEPLYLKDFVVKKPKGQN